METVQQSIFLPYRDGELHLRKISPAAGFRHQIPILMLHGAMSNGRVFYSSRGRGLAPFLAQAGFTVYVMDSAGRGLSTPKLARGFELGQGEVIREQLPWCISICSRPNLWTSCIGVPIPGAGC